MSDHTTAPQPRSDAVVIARIRGGLGNQLFMYAMARRLAQVNHAELAMDHVTGFRGTNKYERQYMLDRFPIKARLATSAERRDPLHRLRRSYRKWADKRRPLAQRHYVMDPGGFDTAVHQMTITHPTTFEGYWQSEKWFSDIAEDIRQELTPEPPKDKANLDMARLIEGSTAVALHVRFFNDPGQTAQSQQVISYYQKAIALIQQQVASPVFFIFSDQPDKAIDILTLGSTATHVVDHNRGDANAHYDIWLMSQCQHFITANSTFSWWGAWLGEKPDSIVVSPVFTEADAFMAWGLPDLVPDRWVSITG